MGNDRINIVQSENEGKMNEQIQCRGQQSNKVLNSSKSDDIQTVLSYDEDTNYLLSLTGYFRRMSTKNKAIAKLRILEYLTELEINGYNENNIVH